LEKFIRGITPLLERLCGEKRSARERQRAQHVELELLLRQGGFFIDLGMEPNPKHTKLVTVWRAQTGEAAARGELFNALLTWGELGVTSRACTVCRREFLRPRAYTGLLCPLCRMLNAFQKERLLDLPKDQRERTAVAAYRAQLEGRPFTDWPDKGGKA